jgi:alkanesulfonate monooxygenase SsuD/methylene tetrahydromethanopterin reductase-like flavin-dependent oxidoreductase (luciferase family)
LFINPQADSRVISLYKEHFQASDNQPSPHAILTISVFCADDEEQAKALQLTYDINLFRFFTGQSTGVSLTPQEAMIYPLGVQERAFIAGRTDSRAVGTPDQVRTQVSQLVKLHNADEIMAVTNMYYFEDRKRSFELLMDAFPANSITSLN